MRKVSDLQLLECKPDATPAEINQAYERLLRRYGTGGLASYGLFRVHERQKFLQALQESFRRLVSNSMGEMYETPSSLPQPTTETYVEEEALGAKTEGLHPIPGMEDLVPGLKTKALETVVEQEGEPEPGAQFPLIDTDFVDASSFEVYNITDIPLDVEVLTRVEDDRTHEQLKYASALRPELPLYTSHALRMKRIEQGLSLEDVARLTQIPEQVLHHIEAPSFSTFAGDLQRLRKVLISIAQVLKLDQQKVVKDYFEAYWSWYAEHGKSR